MVCPYHALAAAAGITITPSKHHHQHASNSNNNSGAKSSSSGAPVPNIPVPLSALLRESTAATHKAVERSAGVRALVGAAPGSDDSAGGSSAAPALFRRDYVRWLIMLAAIYGTLEHIIAELRADHSSNSALAPFLADPELAAILARLQPLLDDIHAHESEMTLESGISLADLADEQALWADDDDDEAVNNTSALRKELLDSVGAFLPLPVASTYIHALTPSQVVATLAYVRRLRAMLPTSESGSDPALALHPARILAHVYVRYMGDLSGGQHIAKRAYARWPLSSPSISDDNSTTTTPSIIAGSPGFVSYAFAQPEWDHAADGERQKTKSAAEVRVKDQIRRALDDALDGESALNHERADVRTITTIRTAVAEVICDEANVSFELSAALFDALMDDVPAPIHLLNSVQTAKARHFDEQLLNPDSSLASSDLDRTLSSSSSSSTSSSDESSSLEHEREGTSSRHLLHASSALSAHHTFSTLLHHKHAATRWMMGAVAMGVLAAAVMTTAVWASRGLIGSHRESGIAMPAVVSAVTL
ncbi:unnamed protein product [Tilletia controversa]|uniref:Heme oxygenase-like protein n=1 Tax=Tilletia controversa TaxID=13291 RepID=A0A8X7T0M5_9BASI|nr:hypothetical protein CF328_g350 [Tilletia controversa]KAE8255366.1 hypothetical protein A4X06_0g462 [Tilletia controversa]CAD6928712.1 unnamed protein product [Tilletia controversa]CAD6935248.1 unnamed protein product [Tilletia controversa]CAD6943191.1 unnamed protein product [Tilletia controversa]